MIDVIGGLHAAKKVRKEVFWRSELSGSLYPESTVWLVIFDLDEKVIVNS